MKFFKTLLSIILSISINIFFTLSALFGIVFNKYYLFDRYENYGTAKSLKMSDLDFDRTVSNLLAYLRGFSILDTTEVNVRNNYKSFYIEKDLVHLADVKKLLFVLLIITILLFILSAFLLYFLFFKKSHKEIRRGFIISDIFSVLFFGFIGVSASVNLKKVIRIGHRLFFNNKKWMLNPARDNLVFLCPQELFKDAGILLLVVFAASLIFSTILVFIATRKLCLQKYDHLGM